MSAIVGIYFLDGRPVERTDLERMVKSVAHMGLDGAGLWSEGSVGLGHRMLWTTPESLHEKLPLVNETGNLVLTADARIDNREELITTLDITGRAHAAISDSELILCAYEKWGERCPERLLGDFVFALWDGRRRVVFCARDHMGVKFLCYHRSGRAFVFATEIKALFCLPEVPRRLNEVRIGDYLVPILEDKAITFYQEILRLPPAHSMTVSADGVRLCHYWSLDRSHDIRLRSDEEYAAAFRGIFTDAVRRRIRSAYPIGSMLSGGLDSSSIVCVARQLLSEDGGGRLHTFSAVFDEVPECDERPFINAVLDQGGLEPHYVYPDQLRPLADLDSAFWHIDQLFLGPNLFMHWALYRAAHEKGVRVLLEGFDGDTTVSHGVTYITELARTGRWVTLAAEVGGLSRNFNVPAWRILRAYLAPLAPEPLHTAWRLLRHRNKPRWDAIIKPDFARRVNLTERVEALRGELFKSIRTSRGGHWHLLTSGPLPYTLEVLGQSAAAFSISPSYPFFDKQLVEFCLALPPDQKLRRGWTRVVMRHAMHDALPDKVRSRAGKSNMDPMLTRTLLARDRGVMEEVVANDLEVVEDYIDTTTFREVYRRYVSSGVPQDALTVWKVVALALWLRRTALAPEASLS